MDKVQRFRNHMAEKGFEYTIEEARELMWEMEDYLELMSRLTYKQLIAITNKISEDDKKKIRHSIGATQEEFDRLVEFIIDIRGL